MVCLVALAGIGTDITGAVVPCVIDDESNSLKYASVLPFEIVIEKTEPGPDVNMFIFPAVAKPVSFE